MMTSDKPILTLNSSKSNINADKLREQMLQRVKQLGITLPPRKNSVKNPEALKNKSSATMLLIPEVSENENNQVNVNPVKAKKINIRLKKIRKLIDYLINTYPKCFSTPPSPLAVGIHKQLWEKELNKENGLLKSKAIIYNILFAYTRNKKYRKSLILGTPRLNLDGTSSSKVIEAELPKPTENC